MILEISMLEAPKMIDLSPLYIIPNWSYGPLTCTLMDNVLPSKFVCLYQTILHDHTYVTMSYLHIAYNIYNQHECTTFAPATVAPMINTNVQLHPKPNKPKPNPNRNPYPTPNQKPIITLTLTLCCRRYRRRNNYRRSKRRITNQNTRR